MHFDLTTILPAIGYVGIFFMVFAESGLLLGFFLPGDSLLFTAGFLASQNIFNIVPLVIGCFIAAVLGDQVGYATGNKFGKKLFQRENSILFHKHYRHLQYNRRLLVGDRCHHSRIFSGAFHCQESGTT